jgi:hypothetical protein
MVVASILHDGLVAIVRARQRRARLHRTRVAHRFGREARRASRLSRGRRRSGLPGTCGSDDLEQPSLRTRARPADGGIAGATTYLTDIAFDADYEYFQKNASSLDFTVADIESIMTQVEFVYTPRHRHRLRDQRDRRAHVGQRSVHGHRGERSPVRVPHVLERERRVRHQARRRAPLHRQESRRHDRRSRLDRGGCAKTSRACARAASATPATRSSSRSSAARP